MAGDIDLSSAPGDVAGNVGDLVGIGDPVTAGDTDPLAPITTGDTTNLIIADLVTIGTTGDLIGFVAIGGLKRFVADFFCWLISEIFFRFFDEELAKCKLPEQPPTSCQSIII